MDGLVIALWCFCALLAGVLGLILVLAIGHWMRDDQPGVPFDPFAGAPQVPWHADDTRSARLRVMLTAMSHREADTAGRAREPLGAHRATP